MQSRWAKVVCIFSWDSDKNLRAACLSLVLMPFQGVKLQHNKTGTKEIWKCCSRTHQFFDSIQSILMYVKCQSYLTLHTYWAVTASLLYPCRSNQFCWGVVLFNSCVCMCVLASPGPVHSAVWCVYPGVLSDWQAKFPPHRPTPPPPQGVPATHANHPGGQQEWPCPLPWNQLRG